MFQTFRLQQQFGNHCNIGGKIEPKYNSVFVSYPRSWRGYRSFASSEFELDNMDHPIGFIDCRQFNA